MVVALGIFVAATAWVYEAYMAQLNNTIALQRCVREIEKEKTSIGKLPQSVHCVDYWGQQLEYFVRDETYVLVSAGRDGRMDAQYGGLSPAHISSASNCFTRGGDTVFVGRRPVRYCLK
jgi:hypothetical protein